jgi:hypothetical protein
LPEPGAPVIPIVYAPPVLRYKRPTASVAASPPASTSEISFAIAARSPRRAASTSAGGLWSAAIRRSPR